MRRKMPMSASVLSRVFVAALAIAVTGVNAAAPTSTTPHAAAPLDELEEVWVRGKRLSEVIRKAEDKFFKAYNKANRNHNYDVHCGEVLLSRTSLAMNRTCLPGFYIYNYLDLAGRAVPQCSTSDSSTTDTDSVDVTTNFLQVSRPRLYTGCTNAPQVPPELMAMEHREKYRRNVLEVIRTNPQLQTMAASLAGLYGEMEAVQNQYVKIRGSAGPQ